MASTTTNETLEGWVAVGSPDDCIRNLTEFIEAGATTITLRLAGFDQQAQFNRVTSVVIPALAGTSPA
jgi:alkanesulfonate monooxygenase SsuD/methylene tetrahydromethanopterin reductase-like flavin-dependent oxidoreductase (luciferase family)